MGQLFSSEEARLVELHDLLMEAHDRKLSLHSGEPAAYNAAREHFDRLLAEEIAISDRIEARADGRQLPMPARTPPFRAPPPEPAAAAVEPSTPKGGASLQGVQQGGSSSIEEGAHAGGAQHGEEGAHASGAECSNVVPLRGDGAGRVAPGLRRRQGHGEEGS